MTWHTDAACAGQPTSLWYPDDRGGNMQARRGDPYAEARLICAGCPVRVDCLNEALASPDYGGMWGGMTQDERKIERRRRGMKVVRIRYRNHGTYGCYQNGPYTGAGPCHCDDCTDAYNAYRRAWREGRTG
jgi:WhiB family transcriptional regulator, redox-sensing transcriptional regulator